MELLPLKGFLIMGAPCRLLFCAKPLSPPTHGFCALILPRPPTSFPSIRNRVWRIPRFGAITSRVPPPSCLLALGDSIPRYPVFFLFLSAPFPLSLLHGGPVLPSSPFPPDVFVPPAGVFQGSSSLHKLVRELAGAHTLPLGVASFPF